MKQCKKTLRETSSKDPSLKVEVFTWKTSPPSLKVHNVFEFQGWGDFLRISENIYTRVILAFYSSLNSFDKDNTSLRSIVRSFELEVLPSNIAEITNTPNDGTLCHGGENWWEELGATEVNVTETLIGKRSMKVRDIRSSHLLTPVRDNELFHL